MKKIFLIAMIALAGCRADGISKDATDNANYNVTTLFTHDGCTVYRFSDAEIIYFVKCDSGSQSTQWETSDRCGKTPCSRPARVETDVSP